VPAYGSTRDEAIRHVQVLALRVIAERLEREESSTLLMDVELVPA